MGTKINREEETNVTKSPLTHVISIYLYVCVCVLLFIINWHGFDSERIEATRQVITGSVREGYFCVYSKFTCKRGSG